MCGCAGPGSMVVHGKRAHIRSITTRMRTFDTRVVAFRTIPLEHRTYRNTGQTTRGPRIGNGRRQRIGQWFSLCSQPGRRTTGSREDPVCRFQRIRDARCGMPPFLDAPAPATHRGRTYGTRASLAGLAPYRADTVVTGEPVQSTRQRVRAVHTHVRLYQYLRTGRAGRPSESI